MTWLGRFTGLLLLCGWSFGCSHGIAYAAPETEGPKRGSPGNARARAYIVSRPRQAGITPLFHGLFEQSTVVEESGGPPYAAPNSRGFYAARWLPTTSASRRSCMPGRPVPRPPPQNTGSSSSCRCACRVLSGIRRVGGSPCGNPPTNLYPCNCCEVRTDVMHAA
jgi:hypothetical protein